MAAGDPQRIWFPEMIEQLRSQWHPGMLFDALVRLRDELDATLRRIRAEGKMRRRIVECPVCGHVGPAEEQHVSVRAMILSLVRFEIAPAEPTYALEKSWAVHRREKGLDLYGKPLTPPAAPSNGCAHVH